MQEFRPPHIMGTKGLKLLKISLLLLIALIGAVSGETVPCDLRETDYGNVCVCTVEHCDFLEDPTPTNDGDFVLVSSTKQGLRFSTHNGKFTDARTLYVQDYVANNETESDSRKSLPKFEPIALLVEKSTAFLELSPDSESTHSTTRYVTLSVNRAQQYQKIVGFGGSFTGAVSHLLSQFPQELQDHLYESYYSAQRGNGFNLMRISIGGCDFDLGPWAYNEEPKNDKELSGFNELNERDVARMAQIKRLKEVSKVENLRIKGAAWSAPPWMKTNNKWTGFGRLKKEYYQTWADYHVKWLDLWAKNGLPIWAISTGNEPLNGIFFMYFVKFMSMGWTPQLQAVWLADNLGPTLRNSDYKDTVLFGNDDQRYSYPYWFQAMNRTRPNSVDYLDGLALHWYWDEIFDAGHIEATTAYLPDKIILSTESCIGDKPWQKSVPLLGSWTRGEKYARAFLQNLKLGLNGWIDWNLILDEKGGPNYVDNTVDAAIIANTTTFEEFYKQPIFYAMGHFTKFIPEGSIRIDAIPSNVNIDSVGFLRPDGTIAAILFNSGRAAVEITVVDSVRGAIVVNVPAKSIHTLIYR